jgi:hypothetical protein
MTTRKSQPNAGFTLALKGLLMLLPILPAASCRKNDAQASKPYLNMQQIASKLDGTLLCGPLTSESDEEGLAIIYDNGKNEGKGLIAMEKIPSSLLAVPGRIEHAEIVCSSFGIIVRDIDQNKLWIYMQNDEKSRQKFQSLQLPQESPTVSSFGDSFWINSLHI